MSSGVITRPRYFHSTGICRQFARVQNGTQAFCCLPLCSNPSPFRRGFRVGVGGRQQQLRLMRPQHARRFRSGGPPAKMTFGKPLGREPESLPVECEQLYRSPATAAEDEQPAGKRIGRKLFPAQLRETVDALSGIDGLDRMRICGAIWIKCPAPKEPGSIRTDLVKWSLSTRRASGLAVLPPR